MKHFSLLLVCAAALSAQTLQISPNPLVMTTQPNTGASATLTFTSSGAALIFLVTPNVSAPWLHVSTTSQLTTPATVTVFTDPMTTSTSSSLTVAIQGQPSIAVPVIVNVSPVGISPTALNFSYVLGGSIPPSQNVSVSLPAGTTASVSKTGNWLNYAVTGGSTPTLITAAIDPVVAPTLTAGVYSGSITVTPTSGSNLTPATVQVTLTVSTTPQVTITPSSLTFNLQIGGTNNQTTQNIQLTAGAQAIPTFSITPGVSWLSVNPSVGSIPANGSQTVAVTVGQPSSNPGTYSGLLTLTTATTQQIAVTVNESATPLLSVSTTPLSFTYSISGALPPAQSVTPTSTAAPGTQIAYTVVANQPWLVVQASGTTPNPVSIGVNPANLTPGSYSGIVTFTSTISGSVGQSVPVTLKVTSNPSLVLGPSSPFIYQINQQQPPPQTITVSSSTGAPLNYTALTVIPWIVLTGHTTGSTNDSFTVAVNTNSLAPGGYSGQININFSDAATGVTLGSVTQSVTLYVSNSAELVVGAPLPVVFTLESGQTSPALPITLTSTSTDILNLSIGQPQIDSGGQWLFTSSQPSATPGTLSVIASPPLGLAPGVYTGRIFVTATNPNGQGVLDSPYPIPVELHLISGKISATAPSLTFTQTSSGPAPAAQNFNVTSDGPVLSFFVSAYDYGLGWLSASPASGATPGTVSVSVDGSRLSPGTYSGRVVVNSNFTGGSPLVIPVTLQVNAGTISAPTTPLVFTAAVGSTTAQTRNVAVSGSPGALSFTTAVNTNGSGNWLSVSPATGTTPGTITVAVNPAGLAMASYSGSVTITSPNATGSPITIPVTLNVVTALTATPTSLSFAAIVAGPAPPGQTVQVQSPSGAVPFTVTTSTNNTGSWLLATPTSGTAPASLTVSINPQGLSAGIYTGSIALNSVTSVQVTLTVSSIPKPVITGITNAASGAANAISPGEVISIYGTGIGPKNPANGVLASNGSVATMVSGTQVSFGGVIFAPIINVWDQQTSVVVPYEIVGVPNIQVQVIYQGVASDPFTVNLTSLTPGLFTQNFASAGPGLIFNSDGHTVNTPSTPAAKGSVIAVYMTGGGLTTPASGTGTIAPSTPGSVLPKPLVAVTATVDGIPADVVYAGAAPGFVAGFMQVNVRIPPLIVRSGVVPLVIYLGASAGVVGTPSQPGVTVAIQ